MLGTQRKRSLEMRRRKGLRGGPSQLEKKVLGWCSWILSGFPGGSAVKGIYPQCRRLEMPEAVLRFGKIPRERNGTHSNIFARIHGQRAWWGSGHEVAESRLPGARTAPKGSNIEVKWKRFWNFPFLQNVTASHSCTFFLGRALAMLRTSQSFPSSYKLTKTLLTTGYKEKPKPTFFHKSNECY